MYIRMRYYSHVYACLPRKHHLYTIKHFDNILQYFAIAKALFVTNKSNFQQYRISER